MAKRRAAKRRPLKKLAQRAKAGAKKRRTRRKARRATVMSKVKKFMGME
jgi:hypothetical protein